MCEMRHSLTLVLGTVLLFSGFVTGCYDPSYQVVTTLTSPKGVRIDPSSNDVDPVAVDCIIDKVEQCLIRKFGNPAVIPEELAASARCSSRTFDLPLARHRLRLKIPNEIPSVMIGKD